MGKPTGFLEYPRCDGAHRPPAERLQDYAEFLLPPDPEELHRQSARCMDCGVPYCHAGMMVAGSSIGCPLMNLIPETNDLVYRGELKAAYERMRKTNPFPEITGRVCPALCEGSCTLGEHDRPVTIQEIERYVADTARANGWDQDPIPDAGDTGRTVAVVGTGPAGLACADSLRRLGHRVTAFERADRPGGFLMYGIPMMKLEKTLVLEQVRRLEERGVVFRTGQDIYAVVTDVDQNLRVSLSHKELLGTWEENAALFSSGETVSGIVRSVEHYGVFVELAPNLAGLAEPKDGVKVGQQASVYIKNLIPEKMKIKLIIIDSFDPPSDVPAPITPLRYFIDSGHLDHWVYSPAVSNTKIETFFA